jgi:indolepyruvate ferredoxin oxidoreductase beta subunit
MSDVLLRGITDAGLRAIVSDTHGIAQRGGLVVSHLRIGDGPMSPLIAPHQADLVIALERLEAVRGLQDMLKTGGRLVYCDAVFQPASVRTEGAPYPSTQDVEAACAEKSARVARIDTTGITDPKMYNTLLLARLIDLDAVPGLTTNRVIAAISHTLPQAAYERNKELFLSLLQR